MNRIQTMFALRSLSKNAPAVSVNIDFAIRSTIILDLFSESSRKMHAPSFPLLTFTDHNHSIIARDPLFLVYVQTSYIIKYRQDGQESKLSEAWPQST